MPNYTPDLSREQSVGMMSVYNSTSLNVRERNSLVNAAWKYLVNPFSLLTATV